MTRLRSALAALAADVPKPGAEPPVRWNPICVRLDDAAAFIGVSKSTMQTLVNDKEVHSFKIGGCTLILWEDLRDFVYRKAGRSVPDQGLPGETGRV